MRTDALVNGIFTGCGVGFIGASLALYNVVKDVMPRYASIWHFKFVAIFGGLLLVLGVGFEVFQRIGAKKREEAEEK